MPRFSLVFAMLAAALTVLPLAAGCGGRTSLRLTATDGSSELAPRIITSAYSYEDENTVHIYLTNLSEAELLGSWAAADADRPVGQMTHIHMFIRPRPGRTPIDANASNTTIRHVILAPQSATGVYAGGGFLLPTSAAASGTFKGSISAGTLTLDAASQNFADALGAVRLRSSIRVEEDDELAATIARRLNEAARTVR
ncbi:MAG: hypothetical protein AAGF47_03220 [Planctomycetota bacterium]